ncbi:hypothetical protein SEA_MUFASA8_75 [Arthrobacter phage Mufasa8]|uniref:Uncharacterized protein n=1 Tax=Arthrobacter phage Mufasa8 TaxID=2656526 RepID=A0A649VPD7_9CAUD|nr:hypothetical protein HYQ08_gp075 [Arthrobacter phage Mufasa8]QGJ93523.1 hypothetical protein SEA_MUFASA8_75 [Arthrobacter phage Mufasa8]
MSLQQAPFYWLQCDHHGCDTKSTEDDEFAAYSDEASAREMAEGSEWHHHNGKDYCPHHADQHQPDTQPCDGCPIPEKSGATMTPNQPTN